MPLNHTLLRSCLAAGIAGDCIGGAFEGRDPMGVIDPLSFDWNMSDDSILSLATAHAIAKAGRVDPSAIAAEFVTEFRLKNIPGLGASTLKALRDLDVGMHWALAGRRGERAAGNGAAMRIAPLAFYLDADNAENRRTIRDVCTITHKNDEAYVGALAILRAMQTESDNLLSIAESLPDTNVRDALSGLAQLPTGSVARDAAACCETSGYVAHSVPLAIFIASTSSDLESAIIAAVECGGDTDTTASMVGQILGARGHELPHAWLDKIPRQTLDELEQQTALVLAPRL